MADRSAIEVIVLFGDTYPSGSRRVTAHRPHGIRNLYEGPERLLIDQIAEDLDLVEPET